MPGTAHTQRPVGQHLDVAEMKRTARVGTPAGRGWGQGVSGHLSSECLVSALTDGLVPVLEHGHLLVVHPHQRRLAQLGVRVTWVLGNGGLLIVGQQ